VTSIGRANSGRQSSTSPTGATVVLLHVFTDEEYADVVEQSDFDDATGVNQATDVARQHTTIRELRSLLDDRNVPSDIRGAVGPHGKRIVDVAEEVDADMVFVGGANAHRPARPSSVAPLRRSCSMLRYQ